MQANNNTRIEKLNIPLSEMPIGGILEFRENEAKKGNAIAKALLHGSSWDIEVIHPAPQATNDLTIIEGGYRVK